MFKAKFYKTQDEKKNYYYQWICEENAEDSHERKETGQRKTCRLAQPLWRGKVEKGKEGLEMTLKEYKNKRMQDPSFVKEYEAVQPEMNIIRAMIDARISQNMTQKELSERTGIAQAEISRLENGTRNPSIKLLQRLADGMDMVLNVSFTPKDAGVSKRV